MAYYAYSDFERKKIVLASSCTIIDKHKEFNRARTDQLKPYSKTYREAEYIKKI